jgi:hypothetical protein
MRDVAQLSKLIRDAKAQGVRRQQRIQRPVIAVTAIILLTVVVLFLFVVARQRGGRMEAPRAVFVVVSFLPTLGSEVLLVSLTHTQPRWSRAVCTAVSTLQALTLVIKLYREAHLYAELGAGPSARLCGALVGSECRAAGRQPCPSIADGGPNGPNGGRCYAGSRQFSDCPDRQRDADSLRLGERVHFIDLG